MYVYQYFHRVFAFALSLLIRQLNVLQNQPDDEYDRHVAENSLEVLITE